MSVAHLFYGILSAFFCGKHDKAECLGEAGCRVHHEAQIPYLSTLLKQRDQRVLEYAVGNFATEHLTHNKPHKSR